MSGPPAWPAAAGAALCSLLLAATPACAQEQAPDPAGGGDDPVARSVPWPQWRGPLGTGEGVGADPPLTWSETRNVRWKTALPGLGHSTPVIWEDRLFVTTAVPVGEVLPPVHADVPGAHDNLPVRQRHRFLVLALDRDTGDVRWEKAVHEDLPHEGGHTSGSLASGSPVTDGARVFAFFGSYGLYCLDGDGAILWQRQFGRMHSKHAHGEGSSPALYGDTLVINWDHEGQSFVAALDARTGDPRWRVDRDEVTSWTSPVVVEVDGQAQVVVAGSGKVRGYDLADGRVVWECGGLSYNVVATPVAADGRVIVGSSYEKQSMLAIRLAGAAGDLTTSDHLEWIRRRRTPYVPSPLLVDGWLYFFHHYQAVLCRVEAATGREPQRPFRLPQLGNVYASPVAAGGRIYLTDLDGTTVVIDDGEVPEVLAVNRLDDGFAASPALAGRQLFLRGHESLYCLEEPAPADDQG